MTEGASVACFVCRHDLDEHDGMGDCKREDGRTLTGYCRCAEIIAASRRAERSAP